MTDEIEFHPYANIFPLMTGEPYAELVRSIRENGLRDPIVLFEGKVIDGRNRFLAAVDAGVEPRFEDLPEGMDPLAYVIDKNLKRRHLDEGQRAMVAAEIAQWRLGDNQFTAGSANRPTQSQAAEMLNVGDRSVRRAAAVLSQGTPEVTDAAKKGEISLTEAEKIARKPADEQAAAATEAKKPKAKKPRTKAKTKAKRKPDAKSDTSSKQNHASRLIGTFGEAIVGMKAIDIGLLVSGAGKAERAKLDEQAGTIGRWTKELQRELAAARNGAVELNTGGTDA
jgi:ParB-like chromosome segregation protein Spo0J